MARMRIITRGYTNTKNGRKHWVEVEGETDTSEENEQAECIPEEPLDISKVGAQFGKRLDEIGKRFAKKVYGRRY